MLGKFLVEERLVEGEAQVQQELLRADLHVVLEDLGRVEVVRVTLTLKGQVSQPQRRKGLLEVVQTQLEDVVHRVKSQL